MWMRMRSHHAMIYILLLAFILRLAAVVYMNNFHTPEVWEDGDIAKNLINGKGFSYGWLGSTQPTSFAAPFYPFFLAPFYYVFGIEWYTYLIIQIIQALISSLTCLIVYAIGRRLFDAHVGSIAGTISAIYPVFIYSTTQVIRVTFIIFFLSLVVLYLLKLNDRPSRKHWIIVGLLFGLSILAEPVLAVFMIFALGWIILASKNRMLALKTVAYICIVTFAMILPWTVRNYMVHKRIMFIKTQSGYALWIGNNPDATGTGRLFSASPTPVKTWGELRKELGAEKLSETECDDILKERAMLFIRENPRKFVDLVGRKFYYFWWCDPTHPLARSMVYLVPYAIILAFAILGMILSCGQGVSGARVSLIYLLFLSLTIPYAITFVLPRYRMPIEPYLIILSSAGLRYLYERLKRRTVGTLYSKGSY